EHGLLVVLGVPVHPPADLGHPQPDAVVLEQRSHRRVLAAAERPLVLPDHDRVPPAVRVRELRDQCGGLRASRPRQGPACPRPAGCLVPVESPSAPRIPQATSPGRDIKKGTTFHNPGTDTINPASQRTPQPVTPYTVFP